MKFRLIIDFEDDCNPPHPNANVTDYEQHFESILAELSAEYPGSKYTLVSLREDGKCYFLTLPEEVQTRLHNDWTESLMDMDLKDRRQLATELLNSMSKEEIDEYINDCAED